MKLKIKRKLLLYTLLQKKDAVISSLNEEYWNKAFLFARRVL